MSKNEYTRRKNSNVNQIAKNFINKINNSSVNKFDKKFNTLQKEKKIQMIFKIMIKKSIQKNKVEMKKKIRNKKIEKSLFSQTDSKIYNIEQSDEIDNNKKINNSDKSINEVNKEKISHLNSSDQIFEFEKSEENEITETISSHDQNQEQGDNEIVSEAQNENIQLPINEQNENIYTNETSLIKINDESLPIKRIISIDKSKKVRRRSLFYQMSLTSQKENPQIESSNEELGRDKLKEVFKEIEDKSENKLEKIQKYLKLQLKIKSKMEKIIQNETQVSPKETNKFPQLIIKKNPKKNQDNLKEEIIDNIFEDNIKSNPKCDQINENNFIKNIINDESVSETIKIQEINDFLLKLNIEKRQRREKQIERERMFIKKIKDKNEISEIEKIELHRKKIKRIEIGERLREIEKRKNDRQESLKLSNKLTKELLKRSFIPQKTNFSQIEKSKTKNIDLSKNRFYNKDYIKLKNNIRYFKSKEKSNPNMNQLPKNKINNNITIPKNDINSKYNNDSIISKMPSNQQNKANSSLPKIRAKKNKSLDIKSHFNKKKSLINEKTILPKLNDNSLNNSSAQNSYKKQYDKKKKFNQISLNNNPDQNDEFENIELLEEEIIDIKKMIQLEQKKYEEGIYDDICINL